MRFKKLRTSFARKYLNKPEKQGRAVQPENWDNVVRMGILAGAEEPYRIEKIIDLVQNLRREGKKVEALLYREYVKNQALPPTPEGVHIFTDKDLNWNFSPKSPVLLDFADKKFDVLWDLNTHGELPLAIISKMSKAGFKAGMEDIYNHHLDLSISLKNLTLDGDKLYGLIENLKIYSKMLHY